MCVMFKPEPCFFRAFTSSDISMGGTEPKLLTMHAKGPFKPLELTAAVSLSTTILTISSALATGAFSAPLSPWIPNTEFWNNFREEEENNYWFWTKYFDQNYAQNQNSMAIFMVLVRFFFNRDRFPFDRVRDRHDPLHRDESKMTTKPRTNKIKIRMIKTSYWKTVTKTVCLCEISNKN